MPIILFGGPLSAPIPAGDVLGEGNTDPRQPDRPGNFSGEVVYLEPDDADYMSRIFKQRTNEIAFCGAISSGESGPQLSVWLADTVQASATNVQFSTANCPAEMDDVILHTHPSGNLGLSRTDKQMIQQRSERIACIQAGQINGETGQPIAHLACYRQTTPQGDSINLVPVSPVLGGSTAS